MAKQKFTVIWGNIGDDPGKRFDHVEAEPNFASIMQAAFQQAYADFGDTYVDWSELVESSYDGYAILDGHIAESAVASFV